MHEMSLMESVVEIACETAQRNGARRITAIRLAIGALSHVDPSALTFCAEAVSKGTMAEGARLDILTIPGEGWCLDCGKAVPLTERFGACPECGQHHVQMTSGDDMTIKDMEIV